MAIASAVFAVPLAFLASGAAVPVLAVGALVGGGAMMLGNSVWASTLQRRIPDDSLSRVSAYDWFGASALYPVGLALWGPVAAAIGVSPALWLAFGLQLAVVCALLTVPEVRRLAADDPVAERETARVP